MVRGVEMKKILILIGILATFITSQAFGVETQPIPIPEPTTILLLGSGLVGLAGLARKRFKK